MKIIFLFSLIVTTILGCTHLPQRAFSWTNNEIYTSQPFIIGGYEALETNLGLTEAELDVLRLESLAFFKSQFGVPTETAIFNTTTKDTVVPGWGIAQTVYFDNCYRLDLTTLDVFQAIRDQIFLTTAEFTFFVSATSGNYGGKYATLFSNFGVPPSIQAGDSFSFGYYYIHQKVGGIKIFLKRLLFGGKFPTRSDLPFRSHEEYYLFDNQWGNGTGILELKFAPTPDGKLLSQFDSVWKLPDTNEFYSVYGL